MIDNLDGSCMMVEYPATKEFPEISVQKKQIQERLREPMRVGQTWYIIDAKWFKTLKYFVGIDNSEHTDTAINPGPIDNSLLLDPKQSNLKPGLVEGLDYEPIPQSAWALLSSWYKLKDNQSPIQRQVINIARPPKIETKLEVYKVRLYICNNSDAGKSAVSSFSQADKIAKIEEVSRTLFPIPPEATVQVRCFYGPNQSQLLSKDNTVYEESLKSDFKIVIETVKEDESAKNFTKPKSRIPRVTTNNNRGAMGPGVVTRNSSMASGSAEGRGPPCPPGLSGLVNLGNTCFFNAILQCLSNCAPTTQYFLDGNHVHEINETNPLGRSGLIASSFADLVSMMWSGKHTIIVPRYFKLQLTKFAPQFAGCQQHDAQELLTFLLDGVHEDLNRVKDKPYCQTEESDDQDDDQALASQSWDYFHRRNDSIIIDHFHGMLKSRVVCPDCEKVSIKFDTFSTLSLPLPLRCDRNIWVRYVPYDQSCKVKDLRIVVPRKGIIRDMANELSKITDVRPEHMVIAEVNKSHFHKFFSMDDPIECIDDREKIFMYNLPAELVEDPERKYTVLPVVLWEVQDVSSSHFLSSLFGMPFLMMLPRGPMYYKTLYNKICERLTRSCVSIDKANENNGCSAMDIDNAEGNDNENENNKFFTPVIVNTFCYENIKNIKDDESDLFEVPESFGREVLALQVPRQKRQEYYRDPVVTQQDNANGYRPVPRPSLDDCLTLFTATEKLGENNAWHCPRCNMKKRATKKLDLWKLPNILILHLKRFAFNETRKEKLDTKVDFPLTGLNIDQYVVNKYKENLKYDLIGVCNHYGNLTGGHYTACCKSRNGKWYCFDDTNVTPVTPESVQSESAYVLFYQRQPTTQADANKEKADM